MSNNKTSNVIESFLKGLKVQTVNVSELSLSLGKKSFAILLFLAALPNAILIAAIPGLSFIFGMILFYTSIQMVFKKPHLKFPKRLNKYTFTKENLVISFKKARPYLLKLENYIRPRWRFLDGLYSERTLGLVLVLNSIIVILPIVFGNFLGGLSILLIAIGMLEKDNLLITLGVGMSFLMHLLFHHIFYLLFVMLIEYVGRLF